MGCMFLCLQQVVCHHSVTLDTVYYAGNVSRVGIPSLVVFCPSSQGQGSVITVQEKLLECALYGINGRWPRGKWRLCRSQVLKGACC